MRNFFRLKLFYLIPISHHLVALTVSLIFCLLYWLCSGPLLILLLCRIYCLLFFKVGMLYETRRLTHDYSPSILWAVLSRKQLYLELSRLLEPSHFLLGLIYWFNRATNTCHALIFEICHTLLLQDLWLCICLVGISWGREGTLSFNVFWDQFSNSVNKHLPVFHRKTIMHEGLYLHSDVGLMV